MLQKNHYKWTITILFEIVLVPSPIFMSLFYKWRRQMGLALSLLLNIFVVSIQISEPKKKKKKKKKEKQFYIFHLIAHLLSHYSYPNSCTRSELTCVFSFSPKVLTSLSLTNLSSNVKVNVTLIRMKTSFIWLSFFIHPCDEKLLGSWKRTAEMVPSNEMLSSIQVCELAF